MEGRQTRLMNVGNLSDHTPLHLAASNGHDKVVKFLLDRGATIERLEAYDVQQTDRQTGKQSKQTNKQTNKQTDRQTDRQNKQTDRQTKQTNKQTKQTDKTNN